MWHTMEINEVRKNFRTNLKTGLTEEEVQRRREKYRLKQVGRDKEGQYSNKIF